MLQRSKDSQSTVNVTDLFEIIFPHRRIVDFREQGLLFKRALCTFRIVQVCVSVSMCVDVSLIVFLSPSGIFPELGLF